MNRREAVIRREREATFRDSPFFLFLESFFFSNYIHVHTRDTRTHTIITLVNCYIRYLAYKYLCAKVEKGIRYRVTKKNINKTREFFLFILLLLLILFYYYIVQSRRRNFIVVNDRARLVLHYVCFFLLFLFFPCSFSLYTRGIARLRKTEMTDATCH